MKNKKPADYNHLKIEPKWRKIWDKKKINQTKDKSKSDKFYVLDMFPYPSGDGLHVGHPRGYIATDVYSKYKRMHGYNVLHPMGWDAFGLPAENYAIKNKIHPAVAMERNVKRFKEQLSIIGLGYDWKREINTTDPNYYKWTQWIFLQLLKKGLAYESFEPINWCPSCKTGLANEDLDGPNCERCGTLVEKKPMRQWVLKITDYADRLLADLDSEDYIMPKVIDKVNPHQPGKPLVKRYVAHAIVFDPRNKKYLIIRNKKFGWDTVIIGGIEAGEDVVKTARREVQEETGYVDIEFKRLLGGQTEAHYYTKHKGENRIAYAQAAYFELKSDKRAPIADGEDKDNEIIWVEEKDFVPGKMVNSELPIWLKRLKDPNLGWPKPLLNWSESIKEAQRNWIGRSEGSELWFNLKNSEEKIRVFTTRPDTLFGVTYVVLAPENKLVDSLKPLIKNWAEVEKYRESVKAKTEIERTAVDKNKTGLRLSGVEAKHPLTKEILPVFIADYVLNNYGTGAVMSVPAHDERDYSFAKKYNLPVKEVVVPYFTKSEKDRDQARSDKETVRRTTAYALVMDKKTNKFLCLDWEKFGWHSGIIGGLDDGESFQAAALREIREETGYVNVKYIRELGGEQHNHFFAAHKDVNRYGIGRGMLFELVDDKKIPTTEAETKNHKAVWIEADKMEGWLNLEAFKYMWQVYKTGSECFTGQGILINSGNFDGMDSEEAKKEITDLADGKQKVTYRLKDWVFSRQRYWGEPIPVIHCEKCGAVPVPEKDLPVELPNVKFYEPTGTGESPLAAISKWVNTKCPNCKGKAKRETNTMPQWAGSSWYYLRYIDPKNSKALVDKKKEKYWMKNGVDLYVGGTEHATRHLIYARFWHKFLFDIGVVSEKEPFRQLKNQGMILGSDSRKMSKRWGNVINPDEVIKNVGADTLRVYEMFMGPFDQEIAWSTDNMVGSRRFLEKVWKLQDRVVNKRVVENIEFEALLHKTIKKVTEDIVDFSFNTAISAFMILVNLAEKNEITKTEYETILKLLAPFAPHMTEEIWANLGHKKSIHLEKWPEYDEKKTISEKVVIIVQINGKPRANFEMPVGSNQAEVEKVALAREDVYKWLAGKQVKKKLFLKERILALITD